VSTEAALTRDGIIDALRGVLDPELHRSIVDLGMVGDVTVDGDRVQVSIKLTVAGCPLKAEIQKRVSDTLVTVPGVEGVHVTLDTMNDEERMSVRSGIIGGDKRASPFLAGARTNVILVASGKGGVGKSSITANLAVALAARGHSVGLLDADVYGYSIPRMMGVNRAPVMLGDDLILPVEAHGVRLMSVGFMASDDQPVIWRGPMLHKALTSFVTEVFWDDPDYLLVDLPPGTGDVSLSLASLAPAAKLLIVTTPQMAAQKVAQRAGGMARRVNLEILGVIENMSWFIAPDTGARYEIFSGGGGQTLAEDLKVPLLGHVPLESDVARAGDEGTPVVLSRPGTAAAIALLGVADAVASRAPVAAAV
jgi:ATP-binding protein involved in chromosome partitioning